MSDPVISIICPVRNELEHIKQCLDSLLSQDFDKSKIEILIVDGMSEDGTRLIVKEYAENNQNIKLLDNPKKIVSSAMNIGIREAKGEIIARVDGHTFLEKDYLKNSVELLNKTKADNVGGLMRPVVTNYFSQCVALSTSTPFGVGNAAFHYSKKEQFVDTVYLGVYPKKVLEKIKLFDEELVRNQDDELNLRIIKNGGKILLSPRIKSYYHPRSSLSTLWRQYFQYGFWKVRVIQKHKTPASWRHLVPGAFVLSLLCSFILSFYMKFGHLLFLGILISYFTSCLLISFYLSLKKGWKYFPLLPVVFAVLHFSYGIGFLRGLVKFLPRWFQTSL